MDSPSFEFLHVRYSNQGIDQQTRTEWQKSVDPDEIIQYEPSHLELDY